MTDTAEASKVERWGYRQDVNGAIVTDTPMLVAVVARSVGDALRSAAAQGRRLAPDATISAGLAEPYPTDDAARMAADSGMRALAASDEYDEDLPAPGTPAWDAEVERLIPGYRARRTLRIEFPVIGG